MNTLLNEHFQPINEDLRFEALSQLRELQSNLVAISFLPVIAIMKETNPLKKDVLAFQDDLDKLTINIQTFISKAKNDVEYEPEEDEIEDEPEEDEIEDEPEEDEIEDEDEGTEEDEEETKKKVVDSSAPKE